MTTTGLVALVCGSRTWTDQETMMAVIVSHDPDTIIHGAARGADAMAGEFAARLGIECREFAADWKTHGKPAGIIRNLAMLGALEDGWMDGREVIVLAFQRDNSRGTQHTLNEADRRGIPVEVYTA